MAKVISKRNLFFYTPTRRRRWWGISLCARLCYMFVPEITFFAATLPRRNVESCEIANLHMCARVVVLFIKYNLGQDERRHTGTLQKGERQNERKGVSGWRFVCTYNDERRRRTPTIDWLARLLTCRAWTRTMRLVGVGGGDSTTHWRARKGAAPLHVVQRAAHVVRWWLGWLNGGRETIERNLGTCVCIIRTGQ